MTSVNLKGILSKKMTRREFLVYLGVLIFALSGISGVFDRINETHSKHLAPPPKRGFGSGPYGI